MRQTDRGRDNTEREREKKGNDKYLTKDKHDRPPNCRQHVTGTSVRQMEDPGLPVTPAY